MLEWRNKNKPIEPQAYKRLWIIEQNPDTFVSSAFDSSCDISSRDTEPTWHRLDISILHIISVHNLTRHLIICHLIIYYDN